MKEHLNSMGIYPSSLNKTLTEALQDLSKHGSLERLWQHDHTLWSDSPEEIENRLGWLHLHETMPEYVNQIEAVGEQLKREQTKNLVLLGMGGSSLAPEVFQKIFGNAPGYPKLSVLDSTDPEAIKRLQLKINLRDSIFIVATKSGTTVETLSFFKYFYNLMIDEVGKGNAGSHFIAITDPGSKLEKLADELCFRKIFLNNPNIGGRYSALSYFGLVPAALIGVDIRHLLELVNSAAVQNAPSIKPEENFAAILGSLLGTAAKNKVDKLTFISDESLASFSDWVEQLIAESTGKSGTGILPVVGEEFTSDLSRYGSDRLFVLHQLNASEKMGRIAQKLHNARLPFIQIQLKDKYELGGLMLIWELATAIAGHIMEIHPFNQPNVESAKILAKKSVHSYEESGKLPDQNTSPLTPESVTEFLQTLRPGDYVSLQAYVDPSISIERAFRELQAALRDKYHVAVTFGLGPRFLHSTGQLHKGDAGRGVFLQFVSHPDEDIPIPDQPGSRESFITFGILKKAQAIGDAKALIQAQRRLITFSIDKSIDENISTLAARL